LSAHVRAEGRGKECGGGERGVERERERKSERERGRVWVCEKKGMGV
jgi:hypothetical protein